MFNDGCESVCSCEEAGKVHCKPRCPKIQKKTSEQCVQVPDPADPCCTVVLCDVTLGDQEVSKSGWLSHLKKKKITLFIGVLILNNVSGVDDMSKVTPLKLKSADAINTTSAIIHFLGEPELDSDLSAEVSEDQMKWNKTALDGVMVHNLLPGKTYYIRVISGGVVSNAVSITLPKSTPSIVLPTMTSLVQNTSQFDNKTEDSSSEDVLCEFKGKNYTLGIKTLVLE